MAANTNNTNTTCPWGQIAKPPVETMNFAAIVRNQKIEKEKQESEKAKKIHREEEELEEVLMRSLKETTNLDDEWDIMGMEEFDANLPPEVLSFLKDEEEQLMASDAAALAECNSDAVIAQMLQAQFDKEYNEDLKRIEKANNKQSKVTVCLDKYLKPYLKDVGEENENDYVEDEWSRDKRDWDRFDTNERLLDAIPKCGYTVDKEGEMITKHDPDLCAIRNACRMMSFPLEFATGDGAGFEMKLSNRVFNQLKTHSRKSQKKTHRMQDRKENEATAETSIDGRTRLLLFKLIRNQILEKINGIISTGKEAVVLHACTDPSCLGGDSSIATQLMPKECAIKIFKTTLNDFKQRDRYIKDDYRFKDRFNVRFSKQNNPIIIKMWAEKEMHNLMRMQTAGINCPEVIILKNHVLVMSFIGENEIAAPKLKNAILTEDEWITAYDEVVEAMHKMYNVANLIHADLSEYNILWHDNKCWFIDVSQSVLPTHTSALEFLMRDCNNITAFFSKKGVSKCHTKEALFEYITSLNADMYNVAMLERIHTKGANIKDATAANLDECPLELRPLEYPFEVAWDKTVEARNHSEQNIISDNAANAMSIIEGEGLLHSNLKKTLECNEKLQKPIAFESVSDTAAN